MRYFTIKFSCKIPKEEIKDRYISYGLIQEEDITESKIEEIRKEFSEQVDRHGIIELVYHSHKEVSEEELNEMSKP